MIFVVSVIMLGLVTETNWEKVELDVAGPTAIAVNSQIEDLSIFLLVANSVSLILGIKGQKSRKFMDFFEILLLR